MSKPIVYIDRTYGDSYLKERRERIINKRLKNPEIISLLNNRNKCLSKIIGKIGKDCKFHNDYKCINNIIITNPNNNLLNPNEESMCKVRYFGNDKRCSFKNWDVLTLRRSPSGRTQRIYYKDKEGYEKETQIPHCCFVNEKNHNEFFDAQLKLERALNTHIPLRLRQHQYELDYGHNSGAVKIWGHKENKTLFYFDYPNLYVDKKITLKDKNELIGYSAF